MASKKFRFVSPGIQIQEIDNSFFPKPPPPDGAVIIGRSEMGPAMRPVTVSSLSDFVNTFGNAIPGKGNSDADVWRNGNYAGPTYGAYAAQAYLKANVGQVTYIRLIGTERSDRNSDATRAGWTTAADHNTAVGSNGGAFGLFVWPSASTVTSVTGTLAAVWYLESGMICLSGNMRQKAVASTGSAALFKSEGDYQQFKAVILDSSGNQISSSISFNFNEDSDIYIRKVFNTNPHLTNTAVSTDTKTYWLGQTYEGYLKTVITGSSATGAYSTSQTCFAAIMGVASGSYGYHDMQGAYQNAETGYFIAQDLEDTGSYDAEGQQELFKFVGLDQGASIQKRFKVSIEDIKVSQNTDITKYGTFTVTLRNVRDTDNAVEVVERYTGCTLDPNSNDYIARKIGDKYVTWDETERRHREYGEYDNQSTYFRVEMNADVEEGTTPPEYLPFGFKGPIRPTGWTAMSGATGPLVYGAEADDDTSASNNRFVVGGAGVTQQPVPSGLLINTGGTGEANANFTGSVKYPRVRVRNSASDGWSSGKLQNAYFGLQTTKNASDATGFDPSYFDMVRPLPRDISSFRPTTIGSTEYAFIFSLDDVVKKGDGGDACWLSGSRASGASLTSASYGQVLDAGFDRFTAPFFGGFDGLDVTEKEPFRNSVLDSTSEKSHYAYATLTRAMDTVADPEVVNMNLIAMPGVTDHSLTANLVNLAEGRGDCLALIDPKGGYIPSTENTSSKTTNRGSASDVITNMKSRKLDSSYGAAYYPWVQIQDSVTNSRVWVPPSVIMLGTIAATEARENAPWFAPAGFNRGGLSDGRNGGFPVINVTERLTKKQRDDLYEVNVNPIAKFPREGIVVFGQKTLQTRASALDRINVRRMLIYLKKKISQVANDILFDQNVRTTWNGFVAKAKPILSDAQARFGISSYKLVLDETTTTADLVDQNALYAKIAIKPTRSIEYIFIDFNITSSGASFDD